MLNGQGKTKSFRFSPKGGEIPRYNLGEIISLTFDIVSRGTIQRADLAADIAENGLINPPVVSPDFVLIAGERRLRACKHLGWQQIEVRIISVKDYEHQLKLEISENQKRKNFTFSEGLEWARRLEQVEKLKARERMSEGAKGTQNFAEPVGESAAVVANETGFGNKETYRQAKFVADHAEPETIAKLDAEETACVRFCGLGYQNGNPA